MSSSIRVRRSLSACIASACIALCMLTGLAACAPGSDLPILPDPPDGPYRLGAGDKIRVITVGAEELTATFIVGDNGTIAVPLLGPIRAEGLSTAQLGDTIRTELDQRHLYRNPSVVVEVTIYRPIDILGEVSRPGEYPFRPGMTLLSAVSLAGGFTYRAITSYASVVRQAAQNKSVEGKVGREASIEPGDVVTIFERRF